MIEESARVVSVGDGYTEVETLRRSACGQCRAQGGCGTSLIARVFPQRAARLRVDGQPGVRAGDEVVIGLDEAALQRASLLLYVVPLLGLLAGALSPHLLLNNVGTGAMELLSIGAGLFGLTAGLFAVARLSRKAKAGSELRARIIRVKSQACTIDRLV